jgi:hypothetical protein
MLCAQWILSKELSMMKMRIVNVMQITWEAFVLGDAYLFWQ